MPYIILDSSVLGGSGFIYAENTLIDRGRSIIVQWSQGGYDEDIELFGYSIRFAEGETEAQEVV
jgi:hypothetical protein